MDEITFPVKIPYESFSFEVVYVDVPHAKALVRLDGKLYECTHEALTSMIQTLALVARKIDGALNYGVNPEDVK